MGSQERTPPHTVCNEIEEDAKKLEQMVTAAKAGNFCEVWSILGPPHQPVKAYLLNAIPENRRWGVVHQVIYWRDPSVLRQLLGYTEFDPGSRTKQCRSEVGDTSRKYPVELARAYGFTDGEIILSEHVCLLTSQSLDTFQPWRTNIESKSLCLIQVTLAAYKNSFHPREIYKNRTVLKILGNIFRDMNHSNRWKAIRDVVSDSVYSVCNETYAKIKGCKNRREFYEAIVNTYTIEENYLYTHLNTALRRQKATNYKPTADDLALGPYVVVYQMLLLFWNDLQREDCVTYRKMMIQQQDLNKYQVGTRFVWLSFVSSSVDLEKAVPFPTRGPKGDHSIIFTIDNSQSTAWQPRNIEAYAQYMERERVYPAGAQFWVTGKTIMNGETHVAIKLVRN